MSKNPFAIKTPEQNTADEIVKLFVDVFSDFYQVPEAAHTFVNGPRGSGKSMMFRYISPDCQRIVKGCEFNELDFFSVYIPIKLTSINIVDFDRLKSHANTILNEHMLVSYVLSTTLQFVLKTFGETTLKDYASEIREFYDNQFKWFIELSGHNEDISIDEEISGYDCIDKMAHVVDKMYRSSRNYCNQLALSKEIPPYSGALVDFIDFLYPLLKELKKLSFFPQEKPLYLLVDDAGYLNQEQTKILNTWVSYRTTKDICLKISTQLDYKTYITANGKRIDAPHDYSEVNIATLYTSSGKDYSKKIKKIVEKRIQVYLEENINAEIFFPSNTEQEESIQKISSRIKLEEFNPEKSYAGPDAARRYSRSEFLKELKKKRAMNKYSFAGFEQLVAISSGVIRHFLAPAYNMYSMVQSRDENKGLIKSIPHSIQNEVIKDYSNNFLFDEFRKIFKDNSQDEHKLKKADKLYNLIHSLGQLFNLILLSERKERTVFSVALNDRPDNELKEILDMGVQHGYFHVSTKRNKDSTGQVLLYVLSRVLAPAFILNPLSFAGYQFMNSSELKVALTKPSLFVSTYSKKLFETEFQSPTLFD